MRTTSEANSNCSQILSESDSFVTYVELIDRNPDIKFNSSEENITELFISGLTASHDLAGMTVSNYLWTVYCCLDGEICDFEYLSLF